MRFLQITKSFLMFMVVLCLSAAVFAQDKTITGTVKDQLNSKPLQGVNVTVKGTKRSVATNADGDFTITASPDATLSFTYVGYAFQEVRVGASSKLNITMVVNTNQMDEVVVVGYGTKKRSEVLGAISTIKGEEIEDIPVANLATALKNRIPGVGISQASGKPGATTSLNIRGSVTSGNLGSSEPLYVIDGIILTKTDFDNLDASMVETISFLKDASAAVYGAAGAKGVVLITTKRGRPGKARINYTGSYGLSDISKLSPTLSGYDQAVGLNDYYALQNFPTNTPVFTKADLDSIKAHEYSWFDDLWQSSSLSRHTLNVSGGTDKITFFVGGNYYHETGNLNDLYVTKYGIRSGMTAKVTDNLTAYISLNTDYAQLERPTYKPDQTDLSDQTMRALLLTPKWVPLSMNGVPVWYNNVNPVWNPAALINSGTYNRTNNQGITLNASLDYKVPFIQGLTARLQFGKTNRQGQGKEYYVPYNAYEFTRYGNNGQLFSDKVVQVRPIANTNRLYESQDFTNSYQLIGSLSYNRKFGKHSVNVIALAEQTESNGDNYSTYRDGQLIPGVDQFFGFQTSTTTLGSASPVEAGKRSYLARASYSFNDRYLFDFVGRYDGSANFPSYSRWGFFPSFGLGWKVSDESFFQQNITFINSLKLRANVGLIGDDRTRGYQFRSRFSPTSGILLGTGTPATATNGLDNNLVPNPYITWEKAFTQNYGADLTFLKGRLNASIDVWKRHTFDALSARTNSLSFTYGTQAADENYAKYDAWGVEATVGYRGNIKRNFGYSIDVNFGRSNNIILQNFQANSAVGTYQDIIGYPSGRQDGYIAKGIIRTQAEVDALLTKNPNYTIGGSKPRVGYLDFVDVNNDGKINDADITKLHERTSSAFGTGFTIGLSYKTLRLSTNIALQDGGYVYYDAIAKTPPTLTQNAAAFWKDHWTPENPNAAFPAFDAPLAKETSTFWERSGTQMRVNNMTLSYALPKSFSDKFHIPDFRAYITGNNLWNLINPFDYKDPASSNFINYPTLRSFTLGISAAL